MFQIQDYRNEIRKTVVGRPGGETLDRGESSPIEWRPEAASVRGEKAGAEQPVTVAERAAPVLHSSLHVLYTHHYGPTLRCPSLYTHH